jgi:hypothetical protein
MRTVRRGAFVALLLVAAAGCSRAPGPSHVASTYRGRLQDDTLVEASTTVLVTKREVVIALDCAPLGVAVAGTASDDASIDRAVAAGVAARLPADVTIYTPPFSSENPRSSPLVVTDDKHAGRLCTPDGYDVAKQ